jgi:hypothetical protein
MRISLFATMFTAAIAIAATPGTARAPQSDSASAEKPKAERKICRWAETTGTRRRERICLTADEWRQVDEHLANEIE